MVTEKIDALMQSRIKMWPVNANRASEVGHDCERYLVYNRLQWKDKQLHDVNLQYLFSEGQRQEKAAIADLQEAGVELVELQRPFGDQDLQLTGHIDWKVRQNGELIPCEFKGLSPFNFDSINSFDDIKSHKQHYVRKYASQIQIYLYLTNSDKGLMLLRNKLLGKYKEIGVVLDWDFTDGLIKKIQRVNECVKTKTFPVRIKDFELCLECPFRHLCVPDLKAMDGIELIEDGVLEQKLDRLAELKPFKAEYEAIDRYVKTTVEGRDNLSVGKYLITGKWVEKTTPPQEEKHSRYWLKKILRV